METRRQYLGWTLGAALAALGRGSACWRAPDVDTGAGRKPELWLADAGLGRGPEGGALVGLDRGGFVQRILRLPAPLALGLRAGRRWVLTEAWSVGERSQNLREWNYREIGRPHPVAGPFALDSWGQPWVLASPGDGAQTLFDPGGSAVLSTGGALRPVPEAAGVSVFNTAGEWFFIQPGTVQRRNLGAQPMGVAAGDGGPLWIGREPSGRILLRHGQRPTVALPSPLQRRLQHAERIHLAPGRRGSAWFTQGSGGWIYHVGPNGDWRTSTDVQDHPRRLLADRKGGVYALLPGAIARLDRNGLRQPGQGGFAASQDLAWSC